MMPRSVFHITSHAMSRCKYEYNHAILESDYEGFSGIDFPLLIRSIHLDMIPCLWYREAIYHSNRFKLNLFECCALATWMLKRCRLGYLTKTHTLGYEHVLKNQ